MENVGQTAWPKKGGELTRGVKKILFYNWVPPFDVDNRGGGVSVYQNNCIQSFRQKGWVVHALSSGLLFDVFRRDPYIKKNVVNGVSSFELVNSTVPAPAFPAFYIDHVSSGIEQDRKIAKTIIDFIKETDPYDVIHFNNLEGIPAAVLPLLKTEFPNTRFVFSLHNYYPFCPQVHFWRQDSATCKDRENGQACVFCMGKKELSSFKTRARDYVSLGIFLRALQQTKFISQYTFLRRIFRKAYLLLNGEKALSFLMSLFGGGAVRANAGSNLLELSHYFNARTGNFSNVINSTFDVILCVSERVKMIAEANGLAADKLRVSYIGTKFYNATPIRNKRCENNAVLHIAYLGYANKIKGYEFLIETLERCDEALLSKLKVTIAAKGIGYFKRRRLRRLSKKLNGISIQNGYQHGDLNRILENVDLGIVPVLWEDCLPQVAIEFVCNGVPILASDLGGAKEIAANKDFEFPAGSYDGLIALLKKFSRDKKGLTKFFETDLRIRSMDMHFLELLDIYECKGRSPDKTGLLDVAKVRS